MSMPTSSTEPIIYSVIVPTCRPLDTPQIQSLAEEIKATTVGSYELIVSSGVDKSAAQNRNIGLEKAKGKYVLMVDDDIRALPQGWNERLVNSLSKWEGFAVVSARLMRPDLTTPGVMCDATYDSSAEYQVARDLPTACVAFKNTHLRFDETFIGSGWEDTDFLRQLGTRRVIDNTIKVVHLNEQKKQDGKIWDANKEFYHTKWSGNFQFIALYKTLLGGEWLSSSLASIYDNVDGIVLVHSTAMWGGDLSIHNNCIFPSLLWAKTNDGKRKIHHIVTPEHTQEGQYGTGYSYIRKHWPGSYVVLIDTDEVWDVNEFMRLKGWVVKNPVLAAYHCRLHTYVKSPLFRVDPVEPCSPTVVIGTANTQPIGVRGANIQPSATNENIKMHHFTAVRKDEYDVALKFRYDEFGDKCKLHQDWMKKIWTRIPDVKDFHYSVGFESAWKRIKIVTLEELPWAARRAACTMVC